MTDSTPRTPAPKRYFIDNVAALIRVMHADRRYALDLRNKAEQHVTLTLRHKYYRASAGLIVDAFNTALMNFLRAGTFRSEDFLAGQPAEGWSAVELATTVLGGYLYRSAHRELIRLLRQRKNENDTDGDAEPSPEPGPSSPPPPKTPEQQILEAEMRRLMKECAHKLSPILGEALAMHFNDYSYAYIAEQLNIKPETAKSRVAEARRLVIECVRKRMG